jgi:hypothetical protein
LGFVQSEHVPDRAGALQLIQLPNTIDLKLFCLNTLHFGGAGKYENVDKKVDNLKSLRKKTKFLTRGRTLLEIYGKVEPSNKSQSIDRCVYVVTGVAAFTLNIIFVYSTLPFYDYDVHSNI